MLCFTPVPVHSPQEEVLCSLKGQALVPWAPTLSLSSSINFFSLAAGARCPAKGQKVNSLVMWHLVSGSMLISATVEWKQQRPHYRTKSAAAPIHLTYKKRRRCGQGHSCQPVLDLLLSLHIFSRSYTCKQTNTHLSHLPTALTVAPPTDTHSFPVLILPST